LGIGQAYMCQETRGAPNSGQMPLYLHHRAPPVHDTNAYAPLGGELHSFPPGHRTSMSYMSDIPRRSSAESHSTQNPHQWIAAWQPQTNQSLGAYTSQSDWQEATPPQQSSSSYQDLSRLLSTINQPSLPLMSVEDAPINISSVREGAGLNETPLATDICPFPICEAAFRVDRPQDLERHIRERHLPYGIYCGQQDCKWTGKRRYALLKHLSDKHSGVPMPEPEAFMIYDVRGLVKQLLNKDINVEQAVGEARSLFREKAGQLGKLGIRRWMRELA